MDDGPDESAGRSQVQACCSYPLSFPSQPPDIKNWFSSYVYESPEVLELLGDHSGDSGSETQDPLKEPKFALPKREPDDGGVPLQENITGHRPEHESFAGEDFVKMRGSAVHGGAKRKQSLRQLFGTGFLDDCDEDASEHCHLLGVEGNAPKPASSCDDIGSANIEGSPENEIEHSKALVNCNGISLPDSEVSSPGVEIEHSNSPVNCNGISLADTQVSSPGDAIEHWKLPVCCDDISSEGTEETSPVDEIRCGKPALEDKEQEEGDQRAADGFVAIKRKEKLIEKCIRSDCCKPLNGRLKPILLGNSINLEQKGCVEGHTRSPLGDRTNFAEVTAAAPTSELSGKWKCPRKGKPYVGPPLKQLRLEQWVHRLR